MTVGRYERKFLVSDLALAEVESLVELHPAHFTQPFPPRRVNNVYLDHVGLANYLDNTGGVARREKYRIRWYGEPFGRIERPVLERKSKFGLLGTKDSFPLPAFDLGPGASRADLRALFGAADLPLDVREAVLQQEPVLLNRYRRSYHLSADGHYRLTIDSELEFSPFDRLGSSFLHVFAERDVVVVEIKYDQEHDREAERIAAVFPFRLTKSSKYAAGIERLLV